MASRFTRDTAPTTLDGPDFPRTSSIPCPENVILMKEVLEVLRNVFLGQFLDADLTGSMFLPFIKANQE
ncbi:hypothetical protein Tco_0843520 [Tanacetum coccineum]|uniref:Uncharacterized protein n=1 Tax=Tanacetum coccineum TaxID=301880 RepID=A0ABQ5B5K6_9ASTR